MLPAGGPEAEARADQICETVHEFVSEGRLAYHPDHTHRKPYYQQVEFAKPWIRAFEQSRLPRFLGHFERLLVAGGGWHFVGGGFSYVDLQVFTVLRVCKFQFAEAYQAPLLERFVENIAARPRIAAYLASERCRPFVGNSMM